MSEIKKSVLGSVRLDSDIWEAVRAMPRSLNQYLRSNLLGEMRLAPKGMITVEERQGKVSATVNVFSEPLASQGPSRGVAEKMSTHRPRKPLLKPKERK